jgi:hypothetical protein
VALRRHMRAAYKLAQLAPLPSPEVTGTLSPADMDTLWAIISFIGAQWNVQQYSTLTGPQFQFYINLKTGQYPSYFTVYQFTTALFAQLVEQLGSLNAALSALYTPLPP